MDQTKGHAAWPDKIRLQRDLNSYKGDKNLTLEELSFEEKKLSEIPFKLWSIRFHLEN